LKFSLKNRKYFISKASSNQYDIAIIGGGITGAGILLDAITRGLKVILIEKEDFAFGTSSRSTKLIHGGLRYLKNLEFGLVRETGLERAIIQKNAAHLVRPENMLLPIFKNGSLGKWTTSLGLMMYDNLAGVEKSEKRQMYSAEKTQELEPLLKSENLISGGLYKEYRTDDSRLVIEILKKAVIYGAIALNYCCCKSFIYDEEKNVNGLNVYDEIDETTFVINAKTVINATGPWVDDVRKLDNEIGKKNLQLTKGIHLVFDYENLPLKQSVYFDAPDGRMIFAIPKNEITYVGTTDTFFSDDKDNPKVKESDILYLLAAVGFMFPSVKLTANDVLSSWVGLRPLISEEGKSPSELSRKDEIFISDSKLLSIAGGKLTGYRKMAERIVDEAIKILKKNSPDLNLENCISKQIKLSGGDFANPKDVDLFCNEMIDQYSDFLEKNWIKDIAYRYGTNATKILSQIKEPSSYNNLLIKELQYSIENESVVNIADFLIRRTSMLYFNPKVAKEHALFLQGFFTDNFPELRNHLSKYYNYFIKEQKELCEF